MTLRTRLLVGLVALAAFGLTVAGAVTYEQLRSHLVDQRNGELQSAMRLPVGAFFARNGFGGDGPATRNLPTGGVHARYLSSQGAVLATASFDYSDAAEPKWPTQITVGDQFTLHSPHYIVDSRVDPSGDVLVVALSMRDVDATLHRLFLVELSVAFGVLVALAALAFWVIKLGLRPLEQMEATAGAIAAGDLSQRVEIEDENTEVGRLGLALNEMLHKIEQAFEERAASESRLRRFVADASHELRTPLTSIRGYAELFRRGAAERPEDLEKTMRRIEEEGARMGVMVDDMLLLARLDQGRPLEREPVDLTRIARDAVDDARAIAPDRVFDYTPNGAVVVAGDETRLRQVFGNLLQNAVRHTPADTPVHVRVADDGADAVIEVRDEGPGMQPDDAARVFERFWRADESRTRASGGTGLGLAIVAAIAEAHGGRTAVDTAPGEGATFRVWLPHDAAPSN